MMESPSWSFSHFGGCALIASPCARGLAFSISRKGVPEGKCAVSKVSAQNGASPSRRAWQWLRDCRPLALIHPAEAAHESGRAFEGGLCPALLIPPVLSSRDQALPSRPMPTVRTHSEGRSPEQGKNAAVSKVPQ